MEKEEYNKVVTATAILFGSGTKEELKDLDEKTFLSVFEGVPQFEVPERLLPLPVIDLLAVHTSVMPSKGECRKLIQNRGLSLNKERLEDINQTIGVDYFLDKKYLLVQRGRKHYFIIKLQRS